MISYHSTKRVELTY